MKAVRVDGGLHTGRSSPERFTGAVWFDAIHVGEAPSRLRIYAVHPAPGARTAWHSHAVGQALHVTEGMALAQDRGREIVRARPDETLV